MAANYIICICADGFDFTGNGYPTMNSGKDGNYGVVDKNDSITASQLGYTPGGAYPQEILNHCPNAPDATPEEARALTRSSYFSDLTAGI